jgi:protein O-mannosyl-transferase
MSTGQPATWAKARNPVAAESWRFELPRESPPSARSAWLFPALLALAVLLAYSNSLGGAFVFDDWQRILEDPSIRTFRQCMSGSSRPLTQLSFYLNYSLGGLHAPDFRLVNIAIHLAGALLLYGIIRRTLDLPGIRGGGVISSRGIAGWSALLWALHPVQTESVTYVVQRAEALMGMFFLATLYAFVRSATAVEGTSRAWGLAAVTACFCGALCKPPMMMAPLAVLLFDRTFASADVREALKRRAWFYAGLFCSWGLLAWLALRPNESSHSTGFASQPQLLTPWEYCATQFEVVLHYIRLSLFPSSLCLDYEWPPAAPGGRLAVSAAVLVAVVMTGGIMMWRRRRSAFPVVSFFLLLAPTSSVIPIADCAAEHRLYLALAAVPLLVMLGLDRALALWVDSRRIASRTARFLGGAAALALVLALGFITRDRNRDYQSEESLWRDVHGKRPLNFRAGSALSGTLLARGEFAEAEKIASETVLKAVQTMRAPAIHRAVAVRAAEAYPVLQDQWARALLGMGRSQEALEHFREAIRANPSYVIARNNLALALLELNRAEEAKAELEQSTGVAAGEAVRQYLFGVAMEKLHRDNDAAVAYEKAMDLQAGLVQPGLRLAWLRAASAEDSVRDPARAAALVAWLLRNSEAGSARILDVHAATLASGGGFDEAVRVQQAAICQQQENERAGPRVNSALRLEGETPFLPPAGDVNSMKERLSLYLRKQPYRLETEGSHKDDVLNNTAP